MKFAVLGDSQEVVWLVEAAIERGHTISGYAEPGPLTRQLRELAPEAVLCDNWESLLEQKIADIVIVAPAADSERRARQLELLVQGRVPLLIAHPYTLSMFDYFQLDMTQDETTSILHWYVPGKDHALLEKMSEFAADRSSPVGKVEAIQFRRQMDASSNEEVLRQLARDSTLISRAFGRCTSVTAMGTTEEAKKYSNLSIQFLLTSGTPVQWSIVQGAAHPEAEVSLEGSAAVAVLEMQPPATESRLRVIRGDEVLQEETSRDETAAVAIDQVTQAVENDTDAGNWIEAARSVELVDAALRSIRRGRSIPIYEEEYSESATFKSKMSAVGCILLTMLFFVSIGLGIVSFVFKVNFKGWPVVVFLFLAVFLMLQLFLPGRTQAPQDQQTADGEEEEVPPAESGTAQGSSDEDDTERKRLDSYR